MPDHVFTPNPVFSVTQPYQPWSALTHNRHEAGEADWPNLYQQRETQTAFTEEADHAYNAALGNLSAARARL